MNNNTAIMFNRQQITEAWACVRKNNHSLPDEALDSMRNVLIEALAAQPAAVPGGAVQANWRDKLRWSKANTDYHGYIAFTPGQLEHFVSMLVGDWEPKRATHPVAVGEAEQQVPEDFMSFARDRLGLNLHGKTFADLLGFFEQYRADPTDVAQVADKPE